MKSILSIHSGSRAVNYHISICGFSAIIIQPYCQHALIDNLLFFIFVMMCLLQCSQWKEDYCTDAFTLFKRSRKHEQITFGIQTNNYFVKLLLCGFVFYMLSSCTVLYSIVPLLKMILLLVKYCLVTGSSLVPFYVRLS